VRSLDIRSDRLVDVAGFPELGSISGSLYIVGENIESISGFPELQTVDFAVNIGPAPSLVSISGLGQLRTVATEPLPPFTIGSTDFVFNDVGLTDLDGLNALTEVGAGLVFLDSHIVRVSGLGA